MNTELIGWRAEDPEGAAPKVGGRSVHVLWTLLRPSFRWVLLEPRRRAGVGTVGWRWQSESGRPGPTPAELKELRERLREALIEMIDELERPGSYAPGVDPMELLNVMRRIVGGLLQSSDTRFATYLVPTEEGWMIRSWGFDPPAKARSDAEDAEASEDNVATDLSNNATQAETPTPIKRRRRRRLLAILIIVGLVIGLGAVIQAGWLGWVVVPSSTADSPAEPSIILTQHASDTEGLARTSGSLPAAIRAPEAIRPDKGSDLLDAGESSRAEVLPPKAATDMIQRATNAGASPVPGAIIGKMAARPGEETNPVGEQTRAKAPEETGLAVTVPTGGTATVQPFPVSAIGEPSGVPSQPDAKPEATEDGQPAGGSDHASVPGAEPMPPASKLKRTAAERTPERKIAHGEEKPIPEMPKLPPDAQVKREGESREVNLDSVDNIEDQPKTSALVSVSSAAAVDSVSLETTQAYVEKIDEPEPNENLPFNELEPQGQPDPPGLPVQAGADEPFTESAVTEVGGETPGQPRLRHRDRPEAEVMSRRWIERSRLRQLADLVLPTLPTQQTGGAALESARKAAREHLAVTRPVAFRTPEVRVGWCLQLAPQASRSGPLHWQDAATGLAPGGDLVAEVNPVDARLSWPEGAIHRSMDLRLVDGVGRQLVRLYVSEDQIRIAITPGDAVRSVDPWLSVARGGADSAPGVLVWRSMTPAVSAGSWEVSADAHETRVVCKAPATKAGLRDYEVALVHPVSGQALSWVIRQR